jgi:hypothetical protein
VIVTACLAWYAESPATLQRCARSLGGLCDVLVAAGGRWDGFPEVAGDDPDVQAAALEQGCREAGIFSSIAWTRAPFASQVEKRTELMRSAAIGTDWLLVIDADEYVVHADADTVTELLEETTADAAQLTGIRVPLTPSSARRPWRRIYRASTGVTLRHAHNGYVTTDGRWLYGDPAHVTLEPVLDLTEHLLLAHDVEARSAERKAARADYLRDRRDRQTETWPRRAVI